MENAPKYHSGTRRYPRLKMDLSVKVVVQQNGIPSVCRGRGNDLGAGGMALYVPAELNLGDLVEVEFTLPYSRYVLKASMEVRNRSGYRYGLQFMGLDPAQLAELERSCGALMLVQ